MDVVIARMLLALLAVAALLGLSRLVGLDDLDDPAYRVEPTMPNAVFMHPEPQP